MREPRNPFRLRASEHIESDATFLRLFGPGVLDLFRPEDGLSSVRILRSAAGGGKTSLLRLFTPGPLATLYAYRARDDCKDLFQRMRDLKAVSDTGPAVLGVMLSCDRNYAALADLDLDAVRQQRLLFALLDARIVLAALRGALALRRLDFPADLSRLTVEGGQAPQGMSSPCTGQDLYAWAKSLEETICDTIDSFDSPEISAPGSETLDCVRFLNAASIKVDGEPVAERLLLMFDDVHKLTKQQRERLVKTVLNLRSGVGIWIAERMEALGTDELLASGATIGRDYQNVILLENFWREKGNWKRFENMVLNIADRRARAASNVEIPSFAASLQSTVDGTEWEEVFRKATVAVSQRVEKLAGSRALFRNWIDDRRALTGTPRETAVAWRSLEVLMEREVRNTQPSFDFALGVDALEQKDDSSLKAAAELFLSAEFNIPYYFGPAILAKLASSNIEQFLWLAGDQFEEVVSAAIINPDKVADLHPTRQEDLLRRATKVLWDEIPRRVPEGRQTRDLLEAIGLFAKAYTYQPNAPNDPGVNGIAISMDDRDKLLDPKYIENNPDHAKLARLLAGALAHNLVDAVLDYKCKGERWMVLNLNRLLCVRFHLPLHYGKFKEKTLAELTRWMKDGFKAPKPGAKLL